MFNIQLLIFASSIILVSALYSTYIYSKLKSKILSSQRFKSKTENFVFKLIVQSLHPLIFFIISVSILFFLIFLRDYYDATHLLKISSETSVSTLSLILKISSIWFIYKIANLSSANKFVNKFFISIIFLISLFHFLGLSEYIIKFVGGFKTNFGNIEISIYKGLLFFFTFTVIFWFGKVFLEVLKKILDTTLLNTNTKVLLVKFGSMVLIAVALITSLVSAGLDLKSLTIFGSALVVGLGFGFQKLVSNIISGITISFEEIIKEGDIIIIDDAREIYGTVKSINMRYILVAEFDGKEVIVPNDTIITNNISNLTHSNNLLRIKIDLILPLNLDLRGFRTDILKIMNSNPYASTVEECVFHILKISEIGVHCFIHFWIDNSFDVFVARTSLMFDILSYMHDNDIKMPPPVSKIELVK